MVYFILRKTLAPIARAIFVKQVSGLENLPKKGPFIVAANHSSYLDAGLLWIVLVSYLNRTVHFVAMKPLAKYFVGRILLGNYFKSVFVNGSVSEALEELKKKEIIAIFPEGGRTHDGELQKIAGTGTGVIACLSKAPVIPVCIDRTFELWPRQKKFPKLKKIASIRFDKKMFFKTHKPSEKQTNNFIKTVMQKIAKLCGKRYYYK